MKQSYGYYNKSGLFAQYVPYRSYNHYSDKHWKTHINYPLNAPPGIRNMFLEDILGFLQQKDLAHKYVFNENNIKYRMNRPDLDNTQNGKIITIYFNNEEECFETMMELDQLIRRKGYINYPLDPEYQFRNDRIFKNNPYIGYRYASTPRQPFYVIPRDLYGREIEDIQGKYLGELII